MDMDKVKGENAMHVCTYCIQYRRRHKYNYLSVPVRQCLEIIIMDFDKVNGVKATHALTYT